MSEDSFCFTGILSLSGAELSYRAGERGAEIGPLNVVSSGGHQIVQSFNGQFPQTFRADVDGSHCRRGHMAYIGIVKTYD